MPDPIRIRYGSAGKHWPEAGRMILAHRLASGPDPFGQNLTQSARTNSDPGWFCTILSGTSAEKRNRVWKWETGSGIVASCQKPGQKIPAHQLASRPDAFGQTRTRTSRSDPGRFCTIWSIPSLEKTELKRMREVGSGIYSPARFWLHAGRNDQNWPEPKRFRIWSAMFTGYINRRGGGGAATGLQARSKGKDWTLTFAQKRSWVGRWSWAEDTA